MATLLRNRLFIPQTTCFDPVLSIATNAKPAFITNNIKMAKQQNKQTDCLNQTLIMVRNGDAMKSGAGRWTDCQKLGLACVQQLHRVFLFFHRCPDSFKSHTRFTCKFRPQTREQRITSTADGQLFELAACVDSAPLRKFPRVSDSGAKLFDVSL